MNPVRFANPYLTCRRCGTSTYGYHRDSGVLDPCGHQDTVSVCPSWSPVDGCACLRRLGRLPHEPRKEDP